MKKKLSLYSLFDVLTAAVTLSVVAFISAAILSILIKGFPYLGEAFFSEEVRFAVKLSLYTASISTFVCFVLAVPTAYSLTRGSFPFKKIAQIIIELPLSMPYLVLGLCLLLIFSSEFGKALRDMGFRVVFDKNGIIMAQIIVNLPYMIRLLKTAFAELDERLEIIAGMLGASRWQRFVTITLPLARNAVISAMILVWSRGLGEFGATLMVVGATRMKTETLPASIYLNMATGDIGAAMASAIIILLISFVSLFATSRLERKNLQASRMKDVYWQ
ncbi:binding-protein-dependent transport systems inner membrane component [Desulfitobacterium hafniense DCB-2]|uniref:Binding-protein-dependent transport systems inner membrane component n=1 Tax=Desulfitobacterium hafniense (strain DSM 10664 / DCB-2) TaxID=272564 RepID=B8FSP9_DESHD|nr:ABC transporter permease subunit [Desulfitobacterium hafniense]ACL20260.1 binding-protein-dependent transport systems inner membrane component [Desulfitobacterium hafniense DCB-2]